MAPSTQWVRLYDKDLYSLTTKMRLPPRNGHAFTIALVCVRGNGRAQTFTVSAHITAARIEYASLVIFLHGHLAVTRMESG